MVQFGDTGDTGVSDDLSVKEDFPAAAVINRTCLFAEITSFRIPELGKFELEGKTAENIPFTARGHRGTCVATIIQ